MNFITLTKTSGNQVVIDVYNIALIEDDHPTKIELYKGPDLEVSQDVAEINILLAAAKETAVV